MAAQAFYVTVIRHQQTGFLAGPFDTHDGALALVDDARKAAREVDDRAWFYAYGTSKVTVEDRSKLPTGVLNDRLGVAKAAR